MRDPNGSPSDVAAGDSILQLDKLVMRFGGLTAVSDLDLSVSCLHIASIIGPNGAGKTTVFNALTGIYEPTQGRITFNGRDPRLPFKPSSLVGIALIAFLTGLGFVIALNLEALWSASITANFIYQKPFPFLKAWGDLFRFIRGLAPSRGLMPFALGAFIGAAGSAAVWLRSRATPNVIAGNGIARTFQNIRLFHAMTAFENVLVALDTRVRANIFEVIFRLPRYNREYRASCEAARELLEFVDLSQEGGELAKNLSYGHQRRLEIARALATRPRLLLLDEPAAGMNPSETVELMNLIRRIRERGITVLLIEHDMRVVMGISDRITVLDYGNRIAEGGPEEIKANPRVIEAYLGKEVVG